MTVRNRNGGLSGPNGEVLNGGTEGRCIEVYVEWTYRYPCRRVWSAGLSLWGFRVSEVREHLVWCTGRKRSKVREVCPC